MLRDLPQTPPSGPSGLPPRALVTVRPRASRKSFLNRKKTGGITGRLANGSLLSVRLVTRRPAPPRIRRGAERRIVSDAPGKRPPPNQSTPPPEATSSAGLPPGGKSALPSASRFDKLPRSGRRSPPMPRGMPRATRRRWREHFRATRAGIAPRHSRSTRATFRRGARHRSRYAHRGLVSFGLAHRRLLDDIEKISDCVH